LFNTNLVLNQDFLAALLTQMLAAAAVDRCVLLQYIEVVGNIVKTERGAIIQRLINAGYAPVMMMILKQVHSIELVTTILW
jgi:hypothetical protein